MNVFTAFLAIQPGPRAKTLLVGTAASVCMFVLTGGHKVLAVKIFVATGGSRGAQRAFRVLAVRNMVTLV